MTKEQLDRHVAVLIEKHGEQHRKLIESAAEFFSKDLSRFSKPHRVFRDLHGMIDCLVDRQEMQAGRLKRCDECGEPVTQCGCGPDHGEDWFEDEQNANLEPRDDQLDGS